MVGRRQFVRTGLSTSSISLILCGVPQGSVLGPILFLLYTADLLLLIEVHGLCPRPYADDTQVYGLCRPSATLEIQNSISNFIDDVARWMRSDRLQLNTTKTKVLWSIHPVDASICYQCHPSEWVPTIKFKLAVVVYKCLHQTAPPYLAEELHPVDADEARQRLRSTSTSSLVVPRTRVSTIGDRAFPVAAARLWNALQLNVTSMSSISVFRKHLKTHLFSHSFPESPVVPVQWLCHFGHYNRSCYLLTSLNTQQRIYHVAATTTSAEPFCALIPKFSRVTHFLNSSDLVTDFGKVAQFFYSSVRSVRKIRVNLPCANYSINITYTYFDVVHRRGEPMDGIIAAYIICNSTTRQNCGEWRQ